MTMPEQDIRERVVSYAKHLASRGPEGMRTAIEKGHQEIVAALDGITEAQAQFKPGPDEWSVLELLRHAVGSKRGTARLCAALARGEAREGSAQLGATGRELPSLAEGRSELDAAHRELLAFVDAVSPDANVEATFAHPWFGAFNCLEWAVFQRPHDADHARQIEQIKSAPAYPK